MAKKHISVINLINSYLVDNSLSFSHIIISAQNNISQKIEPYTLVSIEENLLPEKIKSIEKINNNTNTTSYTYLYYNKTIAKHHIVSELSKILYGYPVWKTSTYTEIIYTINDIHTHGMKVTIKLNGCCKNSTWRDVVSSSDKNVWFKSYNSSITQNFLI